MAKDELSEVERQKMEARMERIGRDEIEDRLADGEVVEVDPEVADEIGAAVDDAMSREDALESRFDGEEEEDG